jgi:hypothetical protein
MASLGISSRGVGDGSQSLNTLKHMLHGEPFRTVRTYHVNADGEPGELEFRQIKTAAEYVIDYINGKRNKSRRKVGIPICDEAVNKVLDRQEGMIECYGDLPKDMGQVSRFAIAWWANDSGHKYIRFFGDRIHLNYMHPAVPRLFSFGQQAYQLVFQCNDPFHCLKCRKDLKVGQGVWRNNSFICDDCVYEQDTGLRQGIGKLRKKKRR